MFYVNFGGLFSIEYDRNSRIGLLDISFIFDQIWSILISL